MNKRQSKKSIVEASRFAAIWRICNVTLHGEVDGITFDFRHADLPAGEWYTPTLRHKLSDIKKPKVEGEPFLWFPWLGIFDEQILRQQVEADADKKNPPSRHKIEETLRLRSPDFKLEAGDVIRVIRVEGIAGSDELEHPHDTQTRKAYLAVERKPGVIIRIPGHMKFYGATALMGVGASSEVFSSIENRILSLFGVNSLNDIAAKSVHSHFAIEAVSKARFIKAGTNDIQSLLQEFPLKSMVHEEAFKIWDLVNASVHLGYFWAKAETELEIKPLAVARKKASKKSKEASHRGAKTRQASQQEWRQKAHVMALRIREDGPFLSRKVMAERISYRLMQKFEISISEASVKAFLMEIEHSGELSPKKRNG